MSLAKRILEEANEDISNTELYQVVMHNIDDLISGLHVLSDEFKNAMSDTVVQDTSALDKTLKSLNNICTELDKSGFTYYAQSVKPKKKLLSEIFNNFIEFYETYADGFEAEDVEILNTNSKDLLVILDGLKQ